LSLKGLDFRDALPDGFKALTALSDYQFGEQSETQKSCLSCQEQKEPQWN
jgi:hypothetical protein